MIALAPSVFTISLDAVPCSSTPSTITTSLPPETLLKASLTLFTRSLSSTENGHRDSTGSSRARSSFINAASLSVPSAGLLAAAIGLKKPTFFPSFSRCLPSPAQTAVLPMFFSREVTYKVTTLHLRRYLIECNGVEYQVIIILYAV